MLKASKVCLWKEAGRGTVVEVEMTPATGLYFKLAYKHTDGQGVVINWGDGSKTERGYAGSGDQYADHTYARHGRYKIVIEGVRSVGMRFLDGQAQYVYDNAIISVVDYCGQIIGSHSGAFKRATNLERFIAPNCQWMGQRDFAYCSKLKEVVIGKNEIYYDGTFQYCSSLEKFTTLKSGVCWSYVWQGCTSLRELNLGDVHQFATQDFDRCPNLMDIWISNKTVDQIMQRAPSGNIEAGYGARFPWNANASCRFHGIDGVVLGNGTRVS